MQLKTFMCVPLSESEGLVEWVMDTKSLRDIITESYIARGIPHMADKKGWDAAQLRVTSAARSPERASTSDKDALLQWLMASYRTLIPVMHSWWLSQYAAACTPALRRAPCISVILSPATVHLTMFNDIVQ